MPRRFPFTGHRSPFVRGAVAATLAVLCLGGILGWRTVGMYYLSAGVWMLGFLALTPLVLRSLFFDGPRWQLALLIPAKLLWPGALLGLCWAGSDVGGAMGAVMAGVSTPLAVVTVMGIVAAVRGSEGSRSAEFVTTPSES